MAEPIPHGGSYNRYAAMGICFIDLKKLRAQCPLSTEGERKRHYTKLNKIKILFNSG